MPPKGSTTSTRSKDKERQATVSPALDSPTPTPSRAISVQTPRHMESSRELELRRTDTPASAFTNSQLRELESMIANAVTQAVTTALRLKEPPAPAPAPEPTYEPTYEPALQRVSVTDIGYFDPRLDESFGKGDIVTCGKDVWFRDVFLFTERIKDIALLKGQDSVQGIITSCFRGSALAWYTAELSDLERAGLRTGSLDLLLGTLIARFKEPSALSLKKLHMLKYDTQDVRQQKEPAAYVQEVVRLSKGAGFDSVINQLLFAWNGLEPVLRQHVDMPTEATTLSSFIRALDLRKDTWYAIHSNYQDPQNRRPPLTQPNRPWIPQRTLGPAQGNYTTNTQANYAEEWQEEVIEADEA
ncbi:hypothetical protein HYFRA_00002572 [Hymenoscyphus fraxineus]|uniref:Retrotransposon gag domain-containing protein n=1 Tax=Hymenoscyphus fraxineus TaxID=746836 RepID=A0A9N9LCM8_9HELO|nr:hypothetical protein HYFRA_00002572 [Hymenoscyphus fraxineus]